MKNDILAIYYKGILSQLNSEVQLINNIFSHNGIKGNGNESAIRELLAKFIPKKYGISSGIVIDKDGNQSRQCDIIIYDNQNYPELLSLTSSKLFPVDLVYAVIEVKTCLDSEKSKIAIENIKSVLELNYIKEEFRTVPTEPVGTINNDTSIFYDKTTTPPLGLVFSFESKTSKINTFLDWFKDDKNGPSHVCCLDQGILLLKSQKKKKYPILYPVIEGNIYQIIDGLKYNQIGRKKYYEYKDRFYPSSKLADQDILVDQGKVLLNFILILTGLLQKKLISTNLDFMKHYLTDDLRTIFTMEDGIIKYHR